MTSRNETAEHSYSYSAALDAFTRLANPCVVAMDAETFATFAEIIAYLDVQPLHGVEGDFARWIVEQVNRPHLEYAITAAGCGVSVHM